MKKLIDEFNKKHKEWFVGIQLDADGIVVIAGHLREGTKEVTVDWEDGLPLMTVIDSALKQLEIKL